MIEILSTVYYSYSVIEFGCKCYFEAEKRGDSAYVLKVKRKVLNILVELSAFWVLFELVRILLLMGIINQQELWGNIIEWYVHNMMFMYLCCKLVNSFIKKRKPTVKKRKLM